jgi:hypothetical protein
LAGTGATRGVSTPHRREWRALGVNVRWVSGFESGFMCAGVCAGSRLPSACARLRVRRGGGGVWWLLGLGIRRVGSVHGVVACVLDGFRGMLAPGSCPFQQQPQSRTTSAFTLKQPLTPLMASAASSGRAGSAAAPTSSAASGSGGVLQFRGCAQFRQRIAFATLSGKRVRIDDIRHKDEEPGLKGAHRGHGGECLADFCGIRPTPHLACSPWLTLRPHQYSKSQSSPCRL